MSEMRQQARGGESSCTEDANRGFLGAESRQKPEANARIVICPYCQSQDVALLALFGAQLLTDQYYCNACHTPFEHVRDE